MTLAETAKTAMDITAAEISTLIFLFFFISFPLGSDDPLFGVSGCGSNYPYVCRMW